MLGFWVTICIIQLFFIISLYDKLNYYVTISVVNLSYIVKGPCFSPGFREAKTPRSLLEIKNHDKIFWLSLELVRIYCDCPTESKDNYTYENDKCVLMYSCDKKDEEIYYVKDITHWLIVDNDENTVNIIKNEYVDEFMKHNTNSKIIAFTGTYKLYDTNTLELYDVRKIR